MEENKNAVTEKDLNKIAGGSSAGFPCPDCGTFISVSAEKLASAGSLVCSCCGLTFGIDHTASSRAVRELKKVRSKKGL